MALFERLGPTLMAKHLGVGVRNIFYRRTRIEGKIGRDLVAPDTQVLNSQVERQRRLELTVQNGVILVGSDAHYWPGRETTAHRGFVRMANDLTPQAIILNGDCADGARISRHTPLGWTKPPTVKEELEAIDARTEEIRSAAPEKCKLYWTWGNHDMRFEMRLAERAAEFEGVKGFHLPDHFPAWKFAWALWINDEVVIKHRFKGGIHAAHNNTATAGKTIVTGHLHSLKVTPYADYNGNRFGVDTGTMAEPLDEQFDYTEDNPLNWRSGFIVLTFHKGKLLWPEVAHVVDANHIEFRGKLIKV